MKGRNLFTQYMLSSLCLFQPSLLVAQTNNDSIVEAGRKEVDWLYLFRSQTIRSSEKEVLNAMDRTPTFAAYKDNFFIKGIPLDRKITNSYADALFQVSMRQCLTKTVLPFNTFTYT